MVRHPPEAAESYARRSSELPFWAAFDGGKPVGFVAVLKYFDQAAEIYVMGGSSKHTIAKELEDFS